MSHFYPTNKAPQRKKQRNIKYLSRNDMSGTTLAFILPSALYVFLCATLMMGCLVTEKIDFDPEQEENFAPTLHDIPGSATPIGELIEVNRGDQTENEIREFSFELQIRDENVTQILKTRYEARTIETDEDPVVINPENYDDVGISGEAIRPFTLTIPLFQLTPGFCYRVELLVSGGFENRPGYWDIPDIEGDIARAKWLMALRSSPEQEVDLDNTCPRLEYNP
jgi:hypothetical protein